MSRTYQLYVPKAYVGTSGVPVVFDFHGYGSNAIEQVVYSNFQPLADAHDFLIVAPDGQVAAGGGAAAARHFNLAGEPGLQDDVAFVGVLLDHLEATACVDVRRVYSTGMSDGGAMTSVLACRDADRFAAFGPVAVVVYVPGCVPARPVAIMSFNGTGDPIVPFNGGAVHCCAGEVLPAPSTSMAGWAAADGCAATPAEHRLGTQVRLRTWSGCRPGGEVDFYIIDGGGHTWPGSAVKISALGLTTDQVSASSTLWAFFAAHALPATAA